MQGFEAFCGRYLKNWEKRSTVRTMPRYVVPPEASDCTFFDSDFVFVSQHPDVVAKGPEARGYLTIQACYRFMEDVAVLETEGVGQLCSQIAHDELRVPLGRHARQVALTVATDEAYHSFVAREFAEQMERTTGVKQSASFFMVGIKEALDWVRSSSSPETAKEFNLIALCIAENSITEELMGIADRTTYENPFHHYAYEHMVDEGRHRVYFQNLLKYYWSLASDELKDQVSQYLPEYLKKIYSMKQWEYHDLASLRELGFSADHAKSIVDEVYSRPLDLSTHPMTKNHMALLSMAGVLDHPAAREALAADGWPVALGDSSENAGSGAGA